jgi:uracil-DNA glycosylase family 4
MPVAQKAGIVPETAPAAVYDAECRRCPRLVKLREAVLRAHPTYWCKPVPPFGDSAARLVIVGLAPGMHGANATGRPFTGDHAGILLYRTLHERGYASAPVSRSRDDPLRLADCRITNAVKCLPPGNKPIPREIRTCNAYLAAELASLPPAGAVLALGRDAHDAALRALGEVPARFPFRHGARHALGRGVGLFDSYHCSRRNTNTGLLTPAMFRDVFDAIDAHLSR